MLSKWLAGSFDRFQEAVRLKRAPHSVIISGSANLGTAMLALYMARLYLCMDKSDGEACTRCRSCQYFSTVSENITSSVSGDEGFDSHPDVVTLLPYETADSQEDGLSRSFKELLSYTAGASEENYVAGIRVDSVRLLCEWLLEGSVFGNGKVAIIAGAHNMNESAANALLKTFEEPPENTLIILLADSLENMPATILSRAYKIQIPRVKTEDALEFIRENLSAQFDENEVCAALAVTDNSPLGALECIRSGLIRDLLEIVSQINRAVAYRGTDLRLSFEAREEAIAMLLRLSDNDRYVFLREFISELLKYKAGISSENLPLLNHRNLSKLCKIPAVTLFDAYSSLNVFRNDISKIQNKAPSAVLRTVIDALSQIN